MWLYVVLGGVDVVIDVDVVAEDVVGEVVFNVVGGDDVGVVVAAGAGVDVVADVCEVVAIADDGVYWFVLMMLSTLRLLLLLMLSLK